MQVGMYRYSILCATLMPAHVFLHLISMHVPFLPAVISSMQDQDQDEGQGQNQNQAGMSISSLTVKESGSGSESDKQSIVTCLVY